MIPVSVLLISLFGMGLQSGFIFADWRREYKPAALLKGLSSAAFVAVGFIGWFRNPDEGAALQVALGLAAGLLGDVLLALRRVYVKAGVAFYISGMLAFLIGHLLYFAALSARLSGPWFPIGTGIAFAILMLLFIGKRLGTKKVLKYASTVYVTVLSVMLSASVFGMIQNPGMKAGLFMFGAALFAASDFMMLLKPKKHVLATRVTHLVIYFIGQLLIAYSLFF
ncbi:MAG: hypothetical protein IJL73_03340 [Lachnospiraceae bacterium]|nr:hypothetical protein [Lachnospiraceae bacterium]